MENWHAVCDGHRAEDASSTVTITWKEHSSVHSVPFEVTVPPAADRHMRVVTWNLEAWNGQLRHERNGKSYKNAAAALAVSNLHPVVTPDAWDVLVLVESGPGRIDELSSITGDTEKFGYEHLPRPGSRSDLLGVLIIWKKRHVERYPSSVESVKIAKKNAELHEFAYHAVPLRLVGCHGQDGGVWVGGVHLKAGDGYYQEDKVRTAQVRAIASAMKPALEMHRSAPRAYVIGGDFNSREGEAVQELQTLLPGGNACARVPRAQDFAKGSLHTTHVQTLFDNNPYQDPIDFALISPSLRLLEVTPLDVKRDRETTRNVGQLKQDGEYRATNVSDHLPLQFRVGFPSCASAASKNKSEASQPSVYLNRRGKDIHASNRNSSAEHGETEVLTVRDRNYSDVGFRILPSPDAPGVGLFVPHGTSMLVSTTLLNDHFHRVLAIGGVPIHVTCGESRPAEQQVHIPRVHIPRAPTYAWTAKSFPTDLQHMGRRFFAEHARHLKASTGFHVFEERQCTAFLTGDQNCLDTWLKFTLDVARAIDGTGFRVVYPPSIFDDQGARETMQANGCEPTHQFHVSATNCNWNGQLPLSAIPGGTEGLTQVLNFDPDAEESIEVFEAFDYDYGPDTRVFWVTLQVLLPTGLIANPKWVEEAGRWCSGNRGYRYGYHVSLAHFLMPKGRQADPLTLTST